MPPGNMPGAPIGIAMIKSSRAGMGKPGDPPTSKPEAWSRIVIERSANGGGTVDVFSDGPDAGMMAPKKMAFESPASLSDFVMKQIGGAPDMPAKDTPSDMGAQAGDDGASDVEAMKPGGPVDGGDESDDDGDEGM